MMFFDVSRLVDFGVTGVFEYGDLKVYSKEIIVGFPKEGKDGKDFHRMQSFKCSLAEIAPYTVSAKEQTYFPGAVERFKQLVNMPNTMVFANVSLEYVLDLSHFPGLYSSALLI